MEILSIVLKNFKSHRDRYLEFRPGTNAICGENGAGKTSVLEAIAWALFDHTDYNKTELIRTGAASAQVAVRFISSLDGRTYEVRRCTSKGYDLYDPQLKLNLGLKRLEDINRWLRQHLGVPTHTELAKLFADIIGIPQGTFTVDFLKTKNERKRVFDPILKVEEYKQTFEQTRDLESYAKAQVEQLQQAIAGYERQLQDWESLQTAYTLLSREISQDEDQLKFLGKRLATLEAEQAQLNAQASQLQQLSHQIQQLETQIAAQESTHQLLSAALNQAQQAVEICQTQEASYLIYQQIQQELQHLELQRKQQQQLLQQRQGQQQLLSDRQQQLHQFQVQLDQLQTAQLQLQQLQPLIAQQATLETQQSSLTQEIQTLEAAKLQQQTLAKQCRQGQSDLERVATQVQQLQALAAEVEQIPQLEEQLERDRQLLSRRLAAQGVATELQQIFTQGQLKCDRQRQQTQTALEGLAKLQPPSPPVEAAIAALESGLALQAELLANLEQILLDLGVHEGIEPLQERLQAGQSQLNRAYQSRAEWATLATHQAEQTRLHQQLQQLQAALHQLQRDLSREPELRQQQTALQTALRELNHPRSQGQLLEQQLQQQPQLQANYLQAQEAAATVQQAIAKLDRQLAVFADLETTLEQQKQLQAQHQAGYQIYLQHEKAARQFAQLQTQLQQAIAAQAALELSRNQLQTQAQTLHQTFEPQRLETLTTNYNQVKTQRDQLQGGLPPKQDQLQSLAAQISHRQAIAQERDQALLELTQKRRLQQWISDARKIYHQSGPRITRYYLQEISQEADRLFRELLNRPDVTLEWTEDYEIRVQERGYWRSFKSLSGGEQMCAALAVRLALLKVLAAIDVAFFDEPTTNMDQPRRLQLAEALANLKTFRQLFVISHDDTFENVTENVIRITPEAE